MTFEWDEAKNRENIAKHGVRFEDAARIFEGPVVSWTDDREDYGEVGEISIGMVGGAAIVTVAHTDRGSTVRIISARPASRAERRRYEETLRNALEP